MDLRRRTGPLISEHSSRTTLALCTPERGGARREPATLCQRALWNLRSDVRGAPCYASEVDIHRQYASVRDLARDDERVLGLVLGGSRGKGVVREGSDYDVDLVVTDDAFDAVREAVASRAPDNDVRVFTLEGFDGHAAWGSSTAWNRYNYVGLHVDFDRTGGELQRIVNEKGVVPERHAKAFIEESLDRYINQTYRSLKGLLVGSPVAHRLEAAEAVRGVLEALFCLHGRRVLPYYKYLQWELARAPLDLLALSSDELLELLLRIVATGDPDAQRKLLAEAARVFGNAGYVSVFDAWGESVPWMLGSAPRSKR